MPFFEDRDLDFASLGRPLFLAPNQPEQRAFVAEMGVDAVLPTDFTRPENFKRAGDILVDFLGEGPYDGASERLFFPIAYCYRHGIELKLKSIIRAGGHYATIANPDPTGHPLVPLWRDARAIILALVVNLPDQLINHLDDRIAELHAVDPNGQMIRYAENLQGQQNRLTIPDRVDLRQLAVNMNVLWWFLDSAHIAIQPPPSVRRSIIRVENGQVDWLLEALPQP